MKDERGDDVPDNESNEWEVGRELMCSSESRNVYVAFHRSLDIYLCTYTLYVRVSTDFALMYRYWFPPRFPSLYFITRARCVLRKKFVTFDLNISAQSLRKLRDVGRAFRCSCCLSR